ncbi:MAG TPA: hypothetical protein VGR11_15770 [Solirubrobacteraceae bacterium]|nr:hypothetical protein [Solirubrobacteraceae bacterium]
MSQTMLAYLDPGSGSIILQAVLGGAAALAVGAKLWWHSALRALHIRRDPEEPPTDDDGSGSR